MKKLIIALLLICCICVQSFAFADKLILPTKVPRTTEAPQVTEAPANASDDESEAIDFDASITNTMTESLDYSGEDWMETSETRAWLTVLLALDVSNALPGDDTIADALLNTSYVGSNMSDVIITVLLYDDSRIINITYCPLLNMSNYYVAEISSVSSELFDIIATSVLGENCEKYEKNSLSDIISAVTSLNSIINGDD